MLLRSSLVAAHPPRGPGTAAARSQRARLGGPSSGPSCQGLPRAPAPRGHPRQPPARGLMVFRGRCRLGRTRSAQESSLAKLLAGRRRRRCHRHQGPAPGHLRREHRWMSPLMSSENRSSCSGVSGLLGSTGGTSGAQPGRCGERWAVPLWLAPAPPPPPPPPPSEVSGGSRAGGGKGRRGRQGQPEVTERPDDPAVSSWSVGAACSGCGGRGREGTG